MRHFWLTVSVVSLQAASVPVWSNSPGQEHFFLRRVVEFWKDRDFATVKAQIEEFLDKHEASGIHDELHAMVGDIYFQEQNFSKALEHYRLIQKKEVGPQTLHRHLLCLKEQKDIPGMIALSSLYLTKYPEGAEEGAREEVVLLSLLAWFEYLEANPKESAEKIIELASFITKPNLLEAANYPLAVAKETLGDYPGACALLELIAEKELGKKEELFLRSALLRGKFDPEGAIKLYDKVLSLQGDKKGVAAHNLLAFLFEQKKYEEIVQREEALKNVLDEKERDFLSLYIGQAYFQIGKWKEASCEFSRFLASGAATEKDLKIALIHQAICADSLEDRDLFARVVQQMYDQFPHEEETASALLLRVRYFLKNGEKGRAVSDLAFLLAEFPSIQNRDFLLYNYGTLLLEEGKLEEGRAQLEELVMQMPESRYVAEAEESLVVASLRLLREEPTTDKRTTLVEDLQRFLSSQEGIDLGKREEYQFILSRTLFDLGRYDEVIVMLEKMVNENPARVEIGNIHLLLGLSTKVRGYDPAKTIYHIKQALALEATILKPEHLHLELFNSYLALGNTQEAAENLYTAFIVLNFPVMKENSIWLAHFYKEQGVLDKAVTCYQKIFGVQASFEDLQIAAEEIALEEEVLQFAEALPLLQRCELLSIFYKKQLAQPEMDWKTKREVLYRLAVATEESGKAQEALALYTTLVSEIDPSLSFYSSAAELSKTRLLYREIPIEDRKEGHPLVVEVLSHLKDLQIRKKLATEPLHLEAALEYVDIRVEGASPEKKTETALFFLERAMADFKEQENRSDRELFPKQAALFDAYLQCMEAELLLWEAQGATDADRAVAAKERASFLFQQILNKEENTPYLKKRIAAQLEMMGS